MENYKNSKIGLETAQKYGDIIEMERPQTEESLRKHPRMVTALAKKAVRETDFTSPSTIVTLSLSP